MKGLLTKANNDLNSILSTKLVSHSFVLNLCFEDKRVVVRVSTIFILVKFECRDLVRDPGARVAADAESRSVHGGWPSGKIPY